LKPGSENTRFYLIEINGLPRCYWFYATFFDTLCLIFLSGHNEIHQEISEQGESYVMQNHMKFTVLSAALAFFALPVVAQSTSASAQGSATASTQVTGQTINQRKENQQDRIAQGVKSGQLTSGEAAHLESNQAKINNEVRTTARPTAAS
jgi:hypothetical protein